MSLKGRRRRRLNARGHYPASISISSAASEAPDACALIDRGVAVSYRALFAEVERAIERLGHGREPAFFSADRSRAAIVEALAHLERRAPIVFLHPRLTGGERRALIECVGRSKISADAAAIFFTSGTTGSSKGAQLSTSAFVASADASAARLGWNADDRWLLALPLAHIGGFSIVARCLMARRTVVLPDSSHFDEEQILQVIERDRVTLVSLVPTMLDRLLSASPSWMPPPHLRAVVLGGAPASERTVAAAKARGIPVLETYGLTEACSMVTLDGAPLPGVEVRVRDERIEIRGPTLMLGYLGIDHHDTFDREGWFATGDLGRFDGAGRLAVLGRRTDLIITGGENVYPLEVERALERCPEVQAVSVFGAPDERWGEVVCAAVVAREASAPAERVLCAIELWARENLASFKRPKRIDLVVELALNSAGKVDRQAVKEASIKRLR